MSTETRSLLLPKCSSFGFRILHGFFNRLWELHDRLQPYHLLNQFELATVVGYERSVNYAVKTVVTPVRYTQ